jgi:hypothetical protein
MKSLFNLTEESIDFQLGDRFTAQADVIFESLIEHVKNVNNKEYNTELLFKEKSNLITAFEKLIKDRFGFKVKLKPESKLQTYSNFPIVPTITSFNKFDIFSLKNHIKRENLDKLEKVLKDLKLSKIVIDTKKANIKGLPAGYDPAIAMDIVGYIVNEDISAKEFTAVFLHELGHIFNNIYYMSTVVSSNLSILNARKRLGKDPSIKEFKLLFAETPMEVQEEISKIKTDNMLVFGYLSATAFADHLVKMVSLGWYSQTSNEQQADSFAARFGYGEYMAKHLTSGLNEKVTTKPLTNTSLTAFYLFMATVMMLFSIFLIIVSFAAGGIVDGVVVGGMGLLISLRFGYNIFARVIYPEGEVTKAYTYDDLKIRISRIKYQTIAALKEADLSKKEIMSIIETIKNIEKQIEKADLIEQNFFEKMSNILFSNNRVLKKTIEVEQLLESLVYNDLFVRDAELKTLA